MSLHPSNPPPSPESPTQDQAARALAPIIPLCEVRRKRQRLAAEQHREDHDPRQVFSAAVRTGRLRGADLFAMVRLGVLTDDPALLPCADPNRRRNAKDWEQAYLEHGERPAPASEVGCPLMAQAASAGAPACAEALRAQAQLPRWDPERGFHRREPDPCDPVLQAGLRPCLLLSRELLRQLLPLCE